MEKKDAPAPGSSQPMSNLLFETAGRCMAYEFALKVLIATHPDAKGCASTWIEGSAQLIEAAMQHPLYTENVAYRNGLNEALGRLAMFAEGQRPESP